MCNHKDNNGTDLVQKINDGSGDVYCPLCGARWNPIMRDEGETLAITKEIISQMQNDKWVGKLSLDIIREYSCHIAFLKKYPKIHAEAMKKFIKYYSSDAEAAHEYSKLFNTNSPVTDEASNTGDK